MIPIELSMAFLVWLIIPRRDCTIQEIGFVERRVLWTATRVGEND